MLKRTLPTRRQKIGLQSPIHTMTKFLVLKCGEQGSVCLPRRQRQRWQRRNQWRRPCMLRRGLYFVAAAPCCAGPAGKSLSVAILASTSVSQRLSPPGTGTCQHTILTYEKWRRVAWYIGNRYFSKLACSIFRFEFGLPWRWMIDIRTFYRKTEKSSALIDIDDRPPCSRYW